MLKLIDATSLQKLIYGISATTLNKSELTELSRVYDSVFAKMFRTFDNHIIKSCQFNFGYLAFNYKYDLSRLTFLKKLYNQSLHYHSFCNLDQRDISEFVKLKTLYNITDSDSAKALKKKVWIKFENDLLIMNG